MIIKLHLDDPDTWPSDTDLPFIAVINENLINLSDIEDDMATGADTHPGVVAERVLRLSPKVVA